VEQDYTDKEPMLDGRMDEFIPHVNTASSDEEEKDFDDGEEQSEFEISDVDLGITPL
jgi:hypothetical protein